MQRYGMTSALAYKDALGEYVRWDDSQSAITLSRVEAKRLKDANGFLECEIAELEKKLTSQLPLYTSAQRAAKDIHIQIHAELRRATALYGPMNSSHEAYAVIAEELCEFWDLVRQKLPSKSALRKELIQIAAMAVRAIHDLDL